MLLTNGDLCSQNYLYILNLDPIIYISLQVHAQDLFHICYTLDWYCYIYYFQDNIFSVFWSSKVFLSYELADPAFESLFM